MKFADESGVKFPLFDPTFAKKKKKPLNALMSRINER
jgi:hypothetical protein